MTKVTTTELLSFGLTIEQIQKRTLRTQKEKRFQHMGTQELRGWKYLKQSYIIKF